MYVLCSVPQDFYAGINKNNSGLPWTSGDKDILKTEVVSLLKIKSGSLSKFIAFHHIQSLFGHEMIFQYMVFRLKVYSLIFSFLHICSMPDAKVLLKILEDSIYI